MIRRYLLLLVLVSALFAGAMTAFAAEPPTAVGKLAAIEVQLYGTEQVGALIERVSRLEIDLYSEASATPILERIDHIYKDIKGGESVHAPTFISRLNAVEWMFTKALTDGPAKTRLENLEKMLSGEVASGGLISRLNSLLAMVYSQGDISVEQTVLPKDSLVKVSLLQEINGKMARPGDKVDFKAEDNIFVGNLLVIPKGSIGHAQIVKVKRANNFGRDGSIELEFTGLLSMDGTYIPLYLGKLAKEATESQIAAAGASAAGMVVFGPVGMIGGLFVHGKDALMPAGTSFFTQVKEDMSVNALVMQNQTANNLDAFIAQNQ